MTYKSDYTPELEIAGSQTVDTGNLLIAEYEAVSGRKIDRCSSGWRPEAVNERTANSGKNSAHIDGEAEDVTGADDIEAVITFDADGLKNGGYARSRFAVWCAQNLPRLKAHELHMEDWHYTARKHTDGTWAVWCHITTRPPHSGLTMYEPFNPAVTPPPIPLTEVA